ncbi:helix-turn-helix domain-containing protein [Carnobacterium sp.]|uniref:helix-turn-helix domain-containing protein n=1 Tax=Carnobacterium sp. TaxID=48221 RepID=UPI003C76292D
MDQLSYLDHFYLSLFSTKQSKKMSTIYHILTGKKTASILYSAEKYQLTHFFALFSKLDRNQFNNSIQKLINLNTLLLAEETQEYYLSENGKNKQSEFFSEHYYPKELNHLKDGLVLIHFWRTLQLVTQVLSEIRYKNKQYIPIEKEWEKQNWVKQWFKNNAMNKDQLALDFGQEWIIILNDLPELNAEIIAANLTGHSNTGKTKNQLVEAFKKESSEISIIELDSIAWITKILKKHPEKIPLFYSVYNEMLHLYDGTTKSALLTKRYLLNGYSLAEIAAQRQLKESTINEHVIEISIMDPLFDLSVVLPSEKLKKLKHLLSENPTITYQELIKKNPEILFLWYRLAQIERNRDSD